MNRQLAIQLMHEMQVNIWDLTDENAEIIRSVLKDPKQQLTLNRGCSIGGAIPYDDLSDDFKKCIDGIEAALNKSDK
tara:strand:- start:516 stop:746 length:231 start_codon:yes stop_codon:yes gene_type:complete